MKKINFFLFLSLTRYILKTKNKPNRIKTQAVVGAIGIKSVRILENILILKRQPIKANKPSIITIKPERNCINAKLEFFVYRKTIPIFKDRYLKISNL
jgi:hypothetical protein